MADLDVVALITAQPGAEEPVGAALRDLVAATRELEEGCLGYDLFESAATPGTFITIERWRSHEDLDAHMQTDHIAAALTAVGELLTEPPAIHPLKPTGA